MKYPPHHYELAHIALRQICFADPYGFFIMMTRDGGKPFLRKLWDQVRANCDEKGQPSFSIDELMINTESLKRYPTILITMPEPQIMPEAYFVGVVLLIPEDKLYKAVANPEVRYFALEKSADIINNKDRTAFCEWKKHEHCLLKFDIETTPEAFLKAIETYI